MNGQEMWDQAVAMASKMHNDMMMRETLELHLKPILDLMKNDPIHAAVVMMNLHQDKSDLQNRYDWRVIDKNTPTDKLIEISVSTAPKFVAIGYYHHDNEEEGRSSCSIVHYNNTVLVPVFYADLWRPIPE